MLFDSAFGWLKGSNGGDEKFQKVWVVLRTDALLSKPVAEEQKSSVNTELNELNG